MGAEKNARQDAADNRRAKQKAGRARRRDAGPAGGFDTVDPVPMLAAIVVATRSGGAVRLGLTRDGGAYAIGCYQGDDYATEYVKPTEDWETAWAELVEAWWPGSLEEYHGLVQWYRQGGQK